VLNDPHRWLAETKVINFTEILLNKLISNTYHSIESVLEKALKGE